MGVDFTYTNVTAATRFLDAPRKLVFLVHGFNSAASEEWVKELRDLILNTVSEISQRVDLACMSSRLLNGGFFFRATSSSSLSIGRRVVGLPVSPVVTRRLW